PRPPPSTLFPYTTLFRSDLCQWKNLHVVDHRGLRSKTSGRIAKRFDERARGKTASLFPQSSRQERLRDFAEGDVEGHEDTKTLEDRKSTRLNSSHVAISY